MDHKNCSFSHFLKEENLSNFVSYKVANLLDWKE